MKNILSILVLLLLMGCSAIPDEVDTAMESFMSENFPNAEYQTVAKKDLYQLVINDSGNAVTKDNVEAVMNQTLGQFFISFYNTSNSKAVDSKLMIVYESETLSWKTDEYSFDELGKMYKFQFK